MKSLKDRLLESQQVNESKVNPDFLEFCKEYAIRELEDNIGLSTCGADLGYELTDTDNRVGSVFKDVTKSKQALEAWVKDYRQWYIDNRIELDYKESDYMIEDPETGDMILDIYSDPEKTATLFVINGVEAVVSQCPTVQKYWNNHLHLDGATIKKICTEVKRVKSI